METEMELIRLDIYNAVRYAYGSNAGMLPLWARENYLSETVSLPRWGKL